MEISPHTGMRGKGERPLLRMRFDEEVERIDHLEIGEQIHHDREFSGLFREYKAREPIAVRILLPVHEMLCRCHGERVAGDSCAAMRARAKPNELRPKTYGLVVTVPRDVVETDEDRHGSLLYCLPKLICCDCGRKTNLFNCLLYKQFLGRRGCAGGGRVRVVPIPPSMT
jgi:hypothetical protein